MELWERSLPQALLAFMGFKALFISSDNRAIKWRLNYNGYKDEGIVELCLNK